MQAKKIIDLEGSSSELGSLMDAAFEESRSKYIEVVERISRCLNKDMYWAFGSIASRNKYYSPLIERLNKIYLVRRILSDSYQPILVLTGDKVLCDVLIQNFSSPLNHIQFLCTERLAGRLWRISRPIRQYVISAALLFLRFMASRNPRKLIEKINLLSKPIVLLDTFVLNNNGDEGGIKNGEYLDRYYPGLFKFLSNEHASLVWYLPTIVGFHNFFKIFKAIRSCSSKFILIDDVIKIQDYFFALSYPFKYLRNKIPPVSSDGVNIDKLLLDEKWNKCSDYMSIQALLYYRFAQRLKERGVRVQRYIDWNENQAIDRAMIKGMRHAYPDASIAAYQGYIISKKLHLYCFPTDSEIFWGYSPDVMYVVGSGLIEDMKEFSKNIYVKVGPAFRFQNVWRRRENTLPLNEFTVLLGLPISLVEAAHISEVVKRATHNFSREFGRFLIKPHPTYSIEFIKEFLGVNEAENIQYIFGDFHVAIEKSNLLISNSSSVCLESLAKGVPVIVVSSAVGVTQNPIPPGVSSQVWDMARDSGEVLRSIEKFRYLSQSNPHLYTEIGGEVREKYFSPVCYDSVISFVFGGSRANE